MLLIEGIIIWALIFWGIHSAWKHIKKASKTRQAVKARSAQTSAEWDERMKSIRK
jgi:hypothetical protein